MPETVGPFTELLLVAGIFFVGASVGSFINVVVYRLPAMGRPVDAQEPHFNLAWPPSHCPHCRAPIKAWHNIPILSYGWLKGRSACCQRQISRGYPARELITGIFTVLVVLILNPRNFSDLIPVVWSEILIWWLLAIACLGGQHSRTTGAPAQTLLWLGLLANLQHQFAPLDQAVLAVCCCYAFGWLAVHSLRLSQRQCSIQMLEVVHLAAAGFAWFGFSLLSTFAGIVIGLSIIAFAVSRLATSAGIIRAYPARHAFGLSAWPTWIQGSLVTVIAFQWLAWTQGA